MRLFGALGGLEDDELRATFNGGIGMVAVVAAGAVPGALTAFDAEGLDARLIGEVAPVDELGRPVRGGAAGAPRMSGGIAVGVSGAGSNLRALAAAADRGVLGAKIVLVFADRECPALDWAAEQGIDTALVPGGDDAALAGTLEAVAPDAVVLAGYMRLIGPKVLAAFPAASSTRIPRSCPRSPAPTRSVTRSRTGSRSPAAPSTSSTTTLDGGPIVAQGPVPVLAGDDEARPARTHPGRRAPAPAAGRGAGGGRGAQRRRASRAPATSSAPTQPCRLRAARCCRCRTRRGLADARDGPRRARVRARVDRRHGPDPARGGPAGHRRRGRDRVPGDARRPGQDAAPARPRRHPRRPAPRGPSPPARRGRDRPVRARRRQPLSVRGRRRAARDHLRRARRGDRHRRAVDGPGRGEEPRQRRDRHRPGSLRRRCWRRSQRGGGIPPRPALARSRSRRSATPPPTTPGSPPSCRRAWPRRGSSCPTSPACPARATRIRRR